MGWEQTPGAVGPHETNSKVIPVGVRLKSLASAVEEEGRVSLAAAGKG